MRNFVSGLVAIGVLFQSSHAIAAGDPALTCEASKLSLTAKYGSCRLKAQSKAVKDGTSPNFSRCSLDKFADAEVKSGGSCPTTGDAAPIANFVDSCTLAVADAVAPGGNTDGLDPLTCATGLAACQSDCVTSVRPPMNSGQTTCYNSTGTIVACAGTEQDGDLLKGAPHSFTDNGDGTITDHTTGLMWEKLSDDNTIHDWNNGYTWSAAFTIKVATLNSSNFAGHNDWRVPNQPELYSLVNFGAANPAIFSAFNMACAPGCSVTTCSCTQPDYYWSSTTLIAAPNFAWEVAYLAGATYAYDKSSSMYVRAVRGGS